MGDQVNYEFDVDLIAITVRTPLAVVAILFMSIPP